jgi:hypothetical protein
MSEKPTYVRAGGSDYLASDYTLPADRTFREAWGDPEGDFITTDMDLAREMWRDNIRNHRKAELERLDAELAKEVEGDNRSDEVARIIAEKQVLRDAPSDPKIDAATTPEELCKVQPIPNVTVTHQIPAPQ